MYNKVIQHYDYDKNQHQIKYLHTSALVDFKPDNKFCTQNIYVTTMHIWPTAVWKAFM